MEGHIYEIMYVNCGVKSYMEVDHCSYRRKINFCSCEKKAGKNNYVAVCRSEVFVKKKDKILTRTQLISVQKVFITEQRK